MHLGIITQMRNIRDSSVMNENDSQCSYPLSEDETWKERRKKDMKVLSVMQTQVETAVPLFM